MDQQHEVTVKLWQSAAPKGVSRRSGVGIGARHFRPDALMLQSVRTNEITKLFLSH